MQRLLELIYKYRAFIFFVFLEVIALSFIFNNNSYQGAGYFNTSNYFVGEILRANSDIRGYFTLGRENKELAAENANLLFLLTKERQKNQQAIANTSDYLRENQFEYIPAHVINNTTNRAKNYFTIDRGTSIGIHPGMGVISPTGVVGEIKFCSENFSTGESILFTKRTVSSKVKNTDVKGFMEWESGDITHAKLLYIARHHKIKVGDTIVTTGFNSLYPEGVAVGVIEKITDDKRAYFDVTLRLATDFTSLAYVYVIENNLKAERDSVELKIEKKINQIK